MSGVLESLCVRPCSDDEESGRSNQQVGKASPSFAVTVDPELHVHEHTSEPQSTGSVPTMFPLQTVELLV